MLRLLIKRGRKGGLIVGARVHTEAEVAVACAAVTAAIGAMPAPAPGLAVAPSEGCLRCIRVVRLSKPTHLVVCQRLPGCPGSGGFGPLSGQAAA